MKNQTEWIIRGVFMVIGLGVIAYSFFSAPQPVTPPAPTQPTLSDVPLPAGGVVMAPAIGAAGSRAGGGGAPPIGGPGNPSAGRGFSGPPGPGGDPLAGSRGGK